MRRTLLLLGVAALVAVPCRAAAAPAGEVAGLCRFDELAKVVKITDKQRAGMQRVLAEYDRKLRAWDASNADRRRRLDGELIQARDDRNAAKLCELLYKQQAVQAERSRIADQCMARLLAVLTPSQRAVWKGHVLFEKMHVRFKRFGLDSGQVMDLRTRCRTAGESISDLIDKGKTGEADKAVHALQREIVLEVLTISQREKFAPRSGSLYTSPGEGESRAEQRERIRLAVMEWSGKRLAADQAKSLKVTRNAIHNAIADAERRWREGINPGSNKGNWRNELMGLINDERRSHDLKAFSSNGNLNSTAQRRADSLGQNNRSSRKKGGKKKKSSGRNRSRGNTGGVEAVVRGPSNARSAFSALLRSARSKILSRSYRSIGLGRRGNTWVAKFGR